MTIDRISSGPLGPIDRSGGGAVTPLILGEASARAVAMAVVARIAGELGITRNDTPIGSDPYRLHQIGAAVVGHFPSSPAASAGELQRAIEEIAAAISADMAARADGGTLDRVDRALAHYEPTGPADDGVATVAAFLERAAREILAAT